MKLIKLIDGSEFEKDKAEMIQNSLKDSIEEIQKNINSIVHIFTYHEEANPKAAQEEIDAMMERMKKEIFIASIDDWVKIDIKDKYFHTQFRLTPGSRFYRVRAVNEENADIQNNPDELFHIPLSKKAIVNNERFSLAGFPSLYLASMLPLAWQECGYPKKYYYSEYQYGKELLKGNNKILEKIQTKKRLSKKESKTVLECFVKSYSADIWTAAVGMYQIFADKHEIIKLRNYVVQIDELCFGERQTDFSYLEQTYRELIKREEGIYSLIGHCFFAYYGL